MVQFMSSENSNVWQLPDPEAKILRAEEHSMHSTQTHEDAPLPKRWKSSSSETSTQQMSSNNNEPPAPQAQYNPLDEPSPLGLRLRKSPSLLELAQKRLNEGISDKDALVIKNLEKRAKRAIRARTKVRASSSVEKLKASHFPALLLRIGQWEYVSKHEGDLVAKCYFSKHKLVWEVLDGGLKKKFEINWADIVGINANCEADGLGTLSIVLGKQPLFFKEINPQPRKHTQWRATSDFTEGEASTNRQHFLQCAQGVLDRHFEKLIQCDTRLMFLSQQQGMALDMPYFPPNPPFINNQDLLANNGYNLSEIASSNNVGSSSLGMSIEAYSSSSGMSMETPNEMLENISQILLSDSQMAVDSDEENLISRVHSLCCLLQDYQTGQPDGNVFFTPDPNQIQQQFQNDGSTLDPAQIPQQYINVNPILDPNLDGHYFSTLESNPIPMQDINDGSTLGANLIPIGDTKDDSTHGAKQIPEVRVQEDGSSSSMSTKVTQDNSNAQQEGNDGSTPENGSGSNEESGLTRADSFSELVHNLPRITSLPRFLFDISESGEILK